VDGVTKHASRVKIEISRRRNGIEHVTGLDTMTIIKWTDN
jgi:hypothetical protein